MAAAAIERPCRPVSVSGQPRAASPRAVRSNSADSPAKLAESKPQRTAICATERSLRAGRRCRCARRSGAGCAPSAIGRSKQYCSVRGSTRRQRSGIDASGASSMMWFANPAHPASVAGGSARRRSRASWSSASSAGSMAPRIRVDASAPVGSRRPARAGRRCPAEARLGSETPAARRRGRSVRDSRPDRVTRELFRDRRRCRRCRSSGVRTKPTTDARRCRWLEMP